MQLGNDCKIAVEATGNWYWLVDLLQDMGLEVVLSNPVQTGEYVFEKDLCGGCPCGIKGEFNRLKVKMVL